MVRVALTDAIPLTAADGVAGRNNSRDIRVGMIGSRVIPDGSAMSARAGVVPRHWHNPGTTWLDMAVLPSGTPSRIVTVWSGYFSCPRAAQSVYLGWAESPVAIELDPADATNPRIDVVWAIVYDQSPSAFPGDPAHGPYIDYTTGTPAATPGVPAIPAGAVKLAEISRPAGPTGDSIDAAKIIDKRASSFWHGAPRPLLPGDSTTAPGQHHGELRLRTTTMVAAPFYAVGVREMIDRWSETESAWRGVSPPSIRIAETTTPLVDNIAHGAEPVITTTSIPDPGYPYRLRITGALDALINPQTALTFRFRTGSGSGTIVAGASAGMILSRNGEPSSGASSGARSLYPHAITSTIFTTAKTLVLTAKGEHQNTASVAAVLAGGNVVYEIVPT